MDLEAALVALVNGRQLAESEIDTSIRKQLAEYGVEATAGVISLRHLEFLNPERIQSKLHESTRSWLRNLDVLACTESTNTDLLEMSRTRHIDGWVRTAEVQTGGRGRRGRQWVSAFAQNIALSIGITIDRSTSEIGAISLAVGSITATVLENLGIQNVSLKWPNDVLIGGRKVGGILIELADAQRPATLVIGIGINVSDAPGLDVTGSYQATRIVDHVDSCSRNALISQLIDGILGAIRKFEALGFGPFKGGWERRDVLRDREIALAGVQPPITGIGNGIDDEGAYLIQTSKGIERAIGGELSLRIAGG